MDGGDAAQVAVEGVSDAFHLGPTENRDVESSNFDVQLRCATQSAVDGFREDPADARGLLVQPVVELRVEELDAIVAGSGGDAARQRRNLYRKE